MCAWTCFSVRWHTRCPRQDPDYWVAGGVKQGLLGEGDAAEFLAAMEADRRAALPVTAMKGGLAAFSARFPFLNTGSDAYKAVEYSIEYPSMVSVEPTCDSLATTEACPTFSIAAGGPLCTPTLADDLHPRT